MRLGHFGKSAKQSKNTLGRPVMEPLEERRLLSGGYPDSTFGAAGMVTTNFTGGFNDLSQIAIQSDGKIVAVGTATTASGKDFLIARYNPNGTIDTTFGTGGQVTVDFSSRADQAESVAIQGDGKILVAGSTANPDSSFPNDVDFAIARLNANGALDSSFGSGGEVTTDFLGGRDSINRILLDGSDILAIGTEAPPSTLSTDFALARYTSSGTLDSTFGTGGKVTTDIGGSTIDTAYDGFVQADNKIVVAGGTLVLGQKGDFALTRYNADGSLDTSFNGTGKVVTDFGGAEEARAVVQSGSQIIAVGRTNANGSDDFALASYNTNGTLNTGFGTGGKTITDLFSGSADYALTAAVDADGRIVVGGSTASAATPNHSLFVLARYNVDGTLDNASSAGGYSFGVAGLSTADPGQGNNLINSIAIDAAGRIVAGGVVPADFSTVNGVLVPASSSFALARYSGTNVDPIFATTPVSGGSTIRVADAITQQPLLTIEPFNGFAGGATVATGDVNGDGYPDIIVAAGAGGSTNIRVFDGKTGAPLPGALGSFLAFPGNGGDPADPQSTFYTQAFQGPVNVAAGDINGDGHDDIIVAVAANGPPHLKVFSGADGSLLMSTLVFPGADSPSDPAYFSNAFSGGVRVAAGDVDGDGKADILAAAGPGADPRVHVYDGPTGNLIRNFDIYDPNYTGGVRIAAGDYNGDGHADIITTPGVGQPPIVSVTDGATGSTLAGFYAYDQTYTGGVWLASTDVNGDGKADILTVPGYSAGPNVKIFAGGSAYVPPAIESFFAFDPTATAGAYIAAAGAVV